MSHVEQKDIKITNPEVGILPNNVPVVDHFLNNYRIHTAYPTQSKASNSSLMNKTKSLHVQRSVEDTPKTIPVRKFH